MGVSIHVDDALLEAGFVQVPVQLLRLPGLSMGAKLLASAILWYSYRLGSWPGEKAAGEEFGVRERSIVRFLRELEAASAIVLARLMHEGG